MTTSPEPSLSTSIRPELIRADDPQLVGIFSEQGATVVRALETVEIELARAIGI